MNPLLKFVLSVLTGLYRLTNGGIGGTMVGLGVLLLTTTGRKSGKQRTTPLGFFEQDENYVIIASNGGSDNHPAWFLNLKSNPKVKVRINDQDFSAVAEETEPALRKKLWERLIELSPMYGRYATSTKREIPIILLKPTPAAR